MSESGHFDALVVLQPLQNTRVLRTDVSLNDILDKPYLLDTVFKSMQLSDDLISFVNQIRANGLD